MPGADRLLALNAGSSTIKFSLFAVERDGSLDETARGVIEDRSPTPRWAIYGREGAAPVERCPSSTASHRELIGDLIAFCEAEPVGGSLIGVGHRIVHGGRRFEAPVRLDKETVAEIDALTPLAPLHQPRSLEAIRTLGEMRPDLAQVGCFDTAFHHALAPPVSRYGIPRRIEAQGIRRYGFHGLSYDWIAGRLAALGPDVAARKTVVAHLGNGASLCAMFDGRSRDTTMGFSALDGLVMGTRCGSLDPAVVLHLQSRCGLSACEVERILYEESGLLGVSEISSDLRDLEASDDPRAKEAIELFTFRIARDTAALACTLGGLECLVFTGGIGEHAADIRAAVCARLGWLGTTLDAAANTTGAAVISAIGSRVTARVIGTDEEAVIGRQTLATLRA